MSTPRKTLTAKRPKRPVLSEPERSETIEKLKAIKSHHAPKALELVRKALLAVKELRDIEDQMSQEASAVHANYNTALPEFKLTFDMADSDIAEQYDHEFIALEDCEEALEKVCADALAACPKDCSE